MIVTATNLISNYLAMTKILVRSLKKYGRVSEKNILVIAYGKNSFECLAIEHEMRKEFRKIRIVKADLSAPDFEFLSEAIKGQHWCLIADYLRAWIGIEQTPYIWLDSDIIVAKPLSKFLRLQGRGKILMAPDRFIPAVSRRFHYMYKKYFGDLPTLFVNSSNQPIFMNCGVIIVNRNYANEWKECYSKLLRKSRGDRYLRKAMWDFLAGQGIWNLLFWRHDGEALSSTFNEFPPSYDASKEYRFSGAIRHYNLDDKSVLLEDALKRKIA